MAIHLCYKKYDIAMTLGAMKYYDSQTGRCLWRDIIAIQEAWHKSIRTCEGAGVIEQAHHRIGSCCDAVPYKDAVYLFKALIDASGEKVSIDEIDDAMFRTGLIPSDRTDEMGEPWPLIMVAAAAEINKAMSEKVKKKPEADLKAD